MDYNINYSIECLLGIERAILSSLISDNSEEKIEESIKIIEANDFGKDNLVLLQLRFDLAPAGRLDYLCDSGKQFFHCRFPEPLAT